MRILHIILILLPICNYSLSAQDTLEQISHINLGSANDLFQQHQKTDKYFSASFAAKVYHKTFDNKIAQKALFSSSKGQNSFALGIRQNGFTPEDLTIANVDSSDRPYAGTLTLNYSQSSYISSQNIKYNTAIKVGVSGALAMVEQVQTGIHENTGSTLPKGWDNQIGNSLIIQYSGIIEKEFLAHLTHLRLGLGGYAEVGSFYNYIMPYATLKVGWFHLNYMTFSNVQYRKDKNMNKWQLYTSIFVSERLVLYDGSLQGGLIPFEESPYTLAWNEYTHHTPHVSFSINVSYKNIQIKYWNVVEIDRFFAENIFSFGSIGLFIPFGN